MSVSRERQDIEQNKNVRVSGVLAGTAVHSVNNRGAHLNILLQFRTFIVGGEGIHVEVGGQPVGIASLLPPCGAQELK